MSKDIFFRDTIDCLINNLTVYDRNIKNIDLKYGDIPQVTPETLKSTLLTVFDAFEKNGEKSIHHNSAYHLGWITATAERYLAANGDFETAAPFIKFLKSTLFKCYLFNNNLGYSLEKGLYKGSGIRNDIADKSIDFHDIYKGKPKNYFDIQFDVDCIYLTYRFSSFFLKMMAQAGYTGEETESLKAICGDFEEFLALSEMTGDMDKKRADALLTKTRQTWPALSYSVAEVSYRYDDRLAIAKALVPEPEISPMRTKESDGHRKKRNRKRRIRNLIILSVVCLILAVIISRIYVFFSGHPERQGWAVLIAMFGLIFTYFMSFPLVGLLFWGQSKIGKLGL